MTVPRRFEDYLAERNAETRPDHLLTGPCDCCGKKAKLVSRDGQCEACMKYAFGYDQAEEHVVAALLGGAVKAALEAELPTELIRRVVDDAIDKDECELGLARKAS